MPGFRFAHKLHRGLGFLTCTCLASREASTPSLEDLYIVTETYLCGTMMNWKEGRVIMVARVRFSFCWRLEFDGTSMWLSEFVHINSVINDLT
jgi:hypothetical protein